MLHALGRRSIRLGAGGAAGLVALASGQGLYLRSQYKPLPEPKGPLRGVVRWARDAPLPQVLRPLRRTLSTTSASTAVGEGQSRLRNMLTVLSGRSLPQQQQQQQQQQRRWRRQQQHVSDDGELPRRNILFVGDSLVTGVGCSHDTPVLPRVVAELIAHRLRVDVSWTAIGQTGGDVRRLHDELLPAVSREVMAAEKVGRAAALLRRAAAGAGARVEWRARARAPRVGSGSTQHHLLTPGPRVCRSAPRLTWWSSCAGSTTSSMRTLQSLAPPPASATSFPRSSTPSTTPRGWAARWCSPLCR